MGRHECLVITDAAQAGADYIPLASLAKFGSNRSLRNYIGSLRRSGSIRCKKLVTRERQMKSGRLYVHREDAEAAVEEWKRKQAAPAEAATSVIERPAARPVEPALPAALGLRLDRLSSDIRSLTTAISDLVEGLTLSAEARLAASGIRREPAVSSFDGDLAPGEEQFVRLPHLAANGEG